MYHPKILPPPPLAWRKTILPRHSAQIVHEAVEHSVSAEDNRNMMPVSQLNRLSIYNGRE
jgi:hypothetical protein